MATSPNYSWPEPDNTDLVKNGALAIRTMGNAIDTTMATMTPKSTYTAKGSIAAATGASTPANLSVGNNGETLVADSSTSTGLRYQSNFAAGKNKIINGDFGIWQRGTSFTPAAGTAGYVADRYNYYRDGSGSTVTMSQQTFTQGTAPVAGYEGQYFFRYNQTVAGTSGTENLLQQYIEDVRTFAGQTLTVSFWAKADSARTLQSQMQQYFGSGGSARVDQTAVSHSVTTSWTRFTSTFTMPSIAGKTIGTGSYLTLAFRFPLNATQTFDIWGVQVEAGSTATAFQTATGTLQGELAACQRYYWRSNGSTAYAVLGNGIGSTTTIAIINANFPTSMRTLPSSVDYSTLAVNDSNAVYAVSNLTINGGNTTMACLTITTSGITAYRPYYLCNNNSTSAYLGFSAEL
jgi:hypothetical protein